MSLQSEFEYLGCKFKHNGIFAWEADFKDVNVQVEIIESDTDQYTCQIYHGGSVFDNMVSLGEAATAEDAMDDAGLHYILEATRQAMKELNTIRKSTVV